MQPTLQNLAFQIHLKDKMPCQKNNHLTQLDVALNHAPEAGQITDGKM